MPSLDALFRFMPLVRWVSGYTHHDLQGLLSPDFHLWGVFKTPVPKVGCSLHFPSIGFPPPFEKAFNAFHLEILIPDLQVEMNEKTLQQLMVDAGVDNLARGFVWDMPPLFVGVTFTSCARGLAQFCWRSKSSDPSVAVFHLLFHSVLQLVQLIPLKMECLSMTMKIANFETA